MTTHTADSDATAALSGGDSGEGEDAQVVPFWLAGRPQTAPESFEVRHPYDGRVVARVAVPTADHVEEAVAAAAEIAPAFAALPAHVRADALESVSRALAADDEAVARTITAESGKPIRWARVEVGRGIANFRAAAEEARRFSGELIRLDSDPVGERRLALVRRFPLGPVMGVTPFNFPLNLVTHKIAPALAVGAPIILKPASQTPLTALRLAELVADTALPEGVLSVLPVRQGPLLDSLVRDPRLPVLSYTGSEIGWDLKAAVPKKQVLLELGGNAAVIVHSDADLALAATRIAAGGNIQAGQTCISTQRVIVHEGVADAFLAHLETQIDALVEGDPFDEATVVGPLVSETAACRVEDWVEEAVAGGARVLCGGRRDGSAYAPTVVTGVTPDMRVWKDEVFGPVVCVTTYRDVEEAFGLANDSRYGLQAGLFTSDLELAFRAHRALDVGAVVVGDSASFRADPAPYGGWKESGTGREGVRFAMEELTAPRTLILSGIEL
jgi:acyl-CoA reductase-like NAD-dependent aldehyde dehydrogenase